MVGTLGNPLARSLRGLSVILSTQVVNSRPVGGVRRRQRHLDLLRQPQRPGVPRGQGEAPQGAKDGRKRPLWLARRVDWWFGLVVWIGGLDWWFGLELESLLSFSLFLRSDFKGLVVWLPYLSSEEQGTASLNMLQAPAAIHKFPGLVSSNRFG